MDQHDRGVRWGPRPPDAKADCEAKTGKTVWGVKSEQIGILATWAGRFWPVSLSWVPWHFLLRAQQTQLYSFNQTWFKVTDDAPFKEWFRQIPPLLVEEVHTHLQEMLDSGTMCPSQSAWYNVVMLVQMKDGGLCFCIDFHQLNADMKKDSYLLLRIHEALESLVNAGHISCLDLKSGFWQIKMDDSSKQYTAFTVGNLGVFECDCMPFGLCNAPATFQPANAKLPWGAASDIPPHLPWWQMAEEHLYCLCIIFDQFREHNLKLKPSKCSFFRKEITHLAHWVSRDRVWFNNWNLEAIAECALPQTYKDMHALLGLVGHCRRFIKGFACIAQPFSEYLTGEGASRKSEWVSLTEDALKAFEALKQAWQPPFWLLLDNTKLFLLENDVSKDGLGTVLLQKQADGWYHPITYGSRALKPHEKNYHSTKLDVLALKWAVMEHFNEYLPYQSFLVRTDNNPLTYIISTPNLDAMGHQWVSALVQFNFELEYQKGHDNTVADALSQVTT